MCVRVCVWVCVCACVRVFVCACVFNPNHVWVEGGGSGGVSVGASARRLWRPSACVQTLGVRPGEKKRPAETIKQNRGQDMQSNVFQS